VISMPRQTVTITLYEHQDSKETEYSTLAQKYKISEKEIYETLRKINREFKNIRSESNDNPDQNKKELSEKLAVFDIRYSDYVGVRHYVGFAAVGNVFVQVLPKVFKPNPEKANKPQINNTTDGNDNKDGTWDSIMAFIRMLNLAYGLKIRDHDLAYLQGRKLRPNLYEIFIYLFAKSLWNEIQRGYHREYVELHSEEKFLRGKLLLSKQIRKLPHQLNTFSVEVHELIEDNLLNRIFYASIRIALGKTAWQTNKKLLEELMLVFDGVTPIRLTREHFERVHFTRLNERFKHPFELAKLLFMPPKGEGRDREVSGFFVDMNELFERFIAKIIRRNLPEDYDLLYQEEYPFLKLRRYTREREKCSKLTKCLPQKPDYVIIRRETPVLVLDAKYREFKENMPSSDMARQLYVYSKILEHDSKEKRKNKIEPKIPAVLIFPSSDTYNKELKNKKYLEFEFFDETKLYVVAYDVETLKSRLDMDMKNIRYVITKILNHDGKSSACSV